MGSTGAGSSTEGGLPGYRDGHEYKEKKHKEGGSNKKEDSTKDSDKEEDIEEVSGEKDDEGSEHWEEDTYNPNYNYGISSAQNDNNNNVDDGGGDGDDGNDGPKKYPGTPAYLLHHYNQEEMETSLPASPDAEEPDPVPQQEDQICTYCNEGLCWRSQELAAEQGVTNIEMNHKKLIEQGTECPCCYRGPTH